ncbi:hypothetical protein KAE70_02735 [Bartonella henselae]|nr:hypothetical protein AT239_06615 [Bartonella henselae]OLL56440.1 hypothetical protein AT240_05790 [Bartonella henselae]UJM33436.1 hypothetical protein KAE70_02735 [Bartonella henselae]
MKKRGKLSNSFHSFLGGTLGYVFLKLLLLSLLVGIVLKLLGWTPLGLVQKIIEFFKFLWATGFTTFSNFFHMVVMGAIVVVPTFLFLRIFRKK